jgi:hypothetical protein
LILRNGNLELVSKSIDEALGINESDDWHVCYWIYCKLCKEQGVTPLGPDNYKVEYKKYVDEK